MTAESSNPLESSASRTAPRAPENGVDSGGPTDVIPARARSRGGELGGKLAYGVFFVVVLPVLLVVWASAAASSVSLPAVTSVPVGIALAASGVAVILWSMLALRVHGEGLPMNAFPPPKYVARGPYRLLAHPIYDGFCVAVAGTSLASGSAAGLWLVTPAVVLGCTALVWGYEAIDLRRRFGRHALTAGAFPFTRSAVATVRPSALERAAWISHVLAPFAAAQAGLHFALGRRIPTEPHELALAAAFAVAPLFLGSREGLERLITLSRRALAAYVALALLTGSPAAHHLALAAVTGAGLIAAARRPHRVWPVLGALLGLFAFEAHARGDSLLASALIAPASVALALVAAPLWRASLALAERIANSWHEWDFGAVRVMSHSLYAGAATFAGVLIAGLLAGEAAVAPVIITALAAIVGSALWAQLLEGSSKLLRPFGFYGGVLGIIIGSASAPLFGADMWRVLAAYSVAAPFVQSIGRLRCLVQGCCHGRPTSPEHGIRYFHARSRVTRLTDLGGESLHATQVYSIAGNVIIALICARMWSSGAQLHLIGGTYLLLGGVARFVEEAYRGEPQTPIYAGLHSYQWIAMVSVAAGAMVTTIGPTRAPPPLQPTLSALVAATMVGLLAAFALGVDFPRSNRRFSRLV